MKCSVFIATSLDGFIATKEGGVDWLDTAGNPDADLGDQADMGFYAFFNTIDCMIMGRKTMDFLAALPPDIWPYGDVRIVVLSTSLKEVPARLQGKVELHAGPIPTLLEKLENEGHEHAYIDGGRVIQAFLDLQRIEHITLTLAPILLGDGIPLFGSSKSHINLQQASAKAYPNDFVQIKYKVSYPGA